MSGQSAEGISAVGVTTRKRKEPPPVARSSGRKRVLSSRALEAEEHAREAREERELEKSKAKAPKRTSRGKAATSTPTSKKGSKKASKKAAPAKVAPYILAIIVFHTNEQDNTTSFWIAPKSKLNKKELKKMEDCHHGGLNDDENRYKEVDNILNKYFSKQDEIYYEKEENPPVKVNQHISEVYHMHFGAFQGDDNDNDNAVYEDEQYE